MQNQKVQETDRAESVGPFDGLLGVSVPRVATVAAGGCDVGQVMSQHGVHTQIIWDTPMLAQNNYNYTRGFQGQYFVHGQKGDPWITDPLIWMTIAFFTCLRLPLSALV